MEVFAADAYPADAPRVALAIGVFDGVHLGHRRLLGVLSDTAATRGLSTLVLTFDPHPKAVLDAGNAPRLLCSLERRLELLAACGIDRCVVSRFDHRRAGQRAASFVADVVVSSLHAAAVVVGEDFRFGHDREGSVELLEAEAGVGDFEVTAVSLIGDDESAVTSSRVRRAVETGELALANELLGRPHELEGSVVAGDGRGRTLGYPTANLAVDPGRCVPGIGIYAGTWVRPDGSRHVAAISVGRRPTFHDDGDVLVEAYLCDFDADLYGERARVEFVARLRGEERFESPEALVRQIARDVEATRAAVTT